MFVWILENLWNSSERRKWWKVFGKSSKRCSKYVCKMKTIIHGCLLIWSISSCVQLFIFFLKQLSGPDSYDWPKLEIRLFYRKLNSRNRANSLSIFHRNSPKYSNDQRGKLDWNWLKFYGERNAGFLAITAPRLQTIEANSHNFKTLNWIYLQWLSWHFKVNCD